MGDLIYNESTGLKAIKTNRNVYKIIIVIKKCIKISMNLKIIKRKKLNEHETVYDIFVQFLAPSRKKKSNLESSRLLNRSLQKYEWLFAKARSRSQPLNRARI